MKKLKNFNKKNNQTWRRLFVYIVILGITIINATAQVTITTNFTNNNGFSQVTFNFQNTNAFDVIITEMGSVTSNTGITTANAYYKTTPINGSPGAISTANGWNSFGTGSYTAISNTTTSTPQTMLTGLSLLVPAGVTYGISFSTANLRYSTLTAGTYTIPGGGCNIITGDNIGYGGDFSPEVPGNTPRGYIGYISFVSATSCSGTPAPGNTLSTLNPVCSGNNFNLSLQNPIFETGITYQWQSSTDNITYSNIAGATMSSYSTTQTVATYYQCIVTCTLSGLADTSTFLQVIINPPSNCYCASNATSTADEEILNVTLGTLNNTSTCSTTGGTGSILNEYSDYTALAPPNIGQSTNVGFSVEVGTCGGNYSNGVAIWIDYNQNGDFTDLGENAYSSSTTTSGPHFETGSFTIPLTATLGNTRMRVICTESSVPSSPCGTYTWGETEDYTVNIAPAPTCIQPDSLNATLVSDISANLGWHANSSETAWDIQYGLNGFSLGTGTIIQNVTTNPYTLSGLTSVTNYQYYVLAQCSPTDSSFWAGPYSFTTLLTACTGVPIVGTASAPASVCVAENLNLALTGFGTDGGINFQWQSSPDNITFSNIAGATSTTYTATQTVATYYQCIVTCTLSGMSDTSNVIQVTMNAPTACYCTSNATSTADEEIFNVTMGTLNNSSNCSTTGGTGSILNEYSNYTAITPTNLIMSLSYPFSVEVNTCGTSNYNSGLAIFIDFNQNGLFTDAGEKVYSNGALANITCVPSTVVSGTIAIPVTALTGNTRMRIIDAEGNPGDNITPCLTYGYGETEDYTVNLLPVPTCPQPTALTASTFTQTSAVLSWTNGGSETSWDIQYGITGFVLGTGTIVNNVTTNPYTLTGLNASSNYQYYVSGQCSPTDSSYWTGPFSFSTLCGPTTALYMQNFDGVTTPAIPNCWSTIVLGSSGSPFIKTSIITPYSVPNCAQLFNSTATGSTTHILLIGPQFSDMPTHTTEIRFMARYAGSGACVLNVGTMSNPTNPTTFSTFQSVTTITNTWQEFVVSFAGYGGSNQTIAFKHGLAVLNQNIYIDDVYYEVIPSCPKPMQITTSNITSTSVDINWNPGGTETSWNIEYGLTGFTQGTGTTVNVTSHPYTLSGLANSSNYQFYIQAYCGVGDSSIWQGPYSFSTPTCNPSEMCMYYLKGTDSGNDGWNGATVTVQQAGITIKVFTVTGGSLYNDSVSICNSANINLIWAGGSWPSECGFEMTDFYGYPVTSFVAGSAPAAGTFFSFAGNCNPPSCPRVTNLTATNLLPTSADLSWTNGGAEAQWQIEYGIYGFIHGTGTFVIANTNPYILSGLSQGLSYSYYVRAICGIGDTSIWQGPYSFTLPCIPYTATYTQNFDAVTAPAIPLCWTAKIAVSGTGAYVQTSTTAPHSAANCVAMYNSANTGATTHILLVSPQFTDLTSHSTQVRFWAKGGSSLIVGTMTDPSNENTFTTLTTINNLNTATWVEYIVSFVGYSGANEHFAFKHGTSSTYTYIYIDDIVYEPAPTNDIAVTQVINPSGGCGLSATENITCKIKNMGAAAQSNIPLGFKINSNPVVGPEIFTGTLNPGDSAIYTFTATADFTSYGSFTVKTFTMDVSDMLHANDTASKTLISSAVVNTFPYFDNFETANNYWTSGGSLNSWQLGAPAGTIINTAASGTNAWMTNLTGYYNNNEASYVVGPCFDFTTLTNPNVRLKRWVRAENSYDGAALQSSIDGGITWQHVGALGDPNGWYNDGAINGLAFSGSQSGWTGYGTGWIASSHAIASLAGQPNVKFRIVFGTDGSGNSYDGFAFDDFEIYETSDLALVYPVAGTYQQCGMSATDTITICVKNVGTTSIPSGDNIYAWYKVDLNAPVADTLTLATNLMPGDSVFFDFSQTYNFSAYTTYLVNNWIDYAGDNNTSNDTIITTQVNYQLTVAIQGGDTILVDPVYLPYTLLVQGSPYTYDTYFWSNSNGSVTGTASTFDAPALGWYYLTVTGGSCTANDSVLVADITNAPFASLSEGISVYPNPTNGKFIVEVNVKNISDFKFDLISADGRKVSSKAYKNVNQIREVYNETKLAEGVYYLKITGNGKQQISKIVIY